MKKVILAFFCVSLLVFINAGKKQKEEVPPGTVVINDTLFADEAEVSVLAWKEFVTYNKNRFGETSIEYLSSLPDTLIWQQDKLDFVPYRSSYFTHPVYNSFPIVGVSREQALAFCKWRTERLNYLMSIKSKKQKIDIDSVLKTNIKYEFRLPTKHEWESFAMIGPTKKLFKTIRNDGKKKTTTWEYYTGRLKEDSLFNIGPFTASGIIKNNLGMSNLFGNVSEMVLEKGIAKGGSWMNTEKEAFVLNDFTYDRPKATIGFRCVCVKRN